MRLPGRIDGSFGPCLSATSQFQASAKSVRSLRERMVSLLRYQSPIETTDNRSVSMSVLRCGVVRAGERTFRHRNPGAGPCGAGGGDASRGVPRGVMAAPARRRAGSAPGSCCGTTWSPTRPCCSWRAVAIMSRRRRTHRCSSDHVAADEPPPGAPPPRRGAPAADLIDGVDAVVRALNETDVPPRVLRINHYGVARTTAVWTAAQAPWVCVHTAPDPRPLTLDTRRVFADVYGRGPVGPAAVPAADLYLYDRCANAMVLYVQHGPLRAEGAWHRSGTTGSPFCAAGGTTPCRARSSPTNGPATPRASDAGPRPTRLCCSIHRAC